MEEFSWPKEAAGMHQNEMRAQNTFRSISNLCVPSNIKTQRNPARELWDIAKDLHDKFLPFLTNSKENGTRHVLLVFCVLDEFSQPKEAVGMHQNGMRAQNTFRGIKNIIYVSQVI